MMIFESGGEDVPAGNAATGPLRGSWALRRRSTP
jgi:hypothetical protein